MTGRVVSTKSKNTVVVLVERQAVHPLYKKSFTRSKRYLVDDAIGVKMGDVVNIEKCKPISRMKHFKVTKVLGQDLEDITKAQLKKGAAEVISEVMPETAESENPQISESIKSTSKEKGMTELSKTK